MLQLVCIYDQSEIEVNFQKSIQKYPLLNYKIVDNFMRCDWTSSKIMV